MERLKQVIDRLLAGLVIVIMAVLVIDVLWQVFTRFVLRNPSSYTEELARFLLIWLGLLGGSYAAGQHLHLAVDLLPGRLQGRQRQILELIIEACTLAFALLLIVGGARLVWLMLYLGQISAALQVPLGYVYLVLPLSGAFIGFYSIYYLWKGVRALQTAEAPVDPQKPAD